MEEHKREKINFAAIIALDFTEEEGNDEVFENIHGYPYRIYTKKLTKKIYIDWQQDTRLCEMVRVDPKNGDVFARMPLNDLEQIKNIIAFYHDVH